MRDTAIGGLASLLNRQEWRESEAQPTIAAVVSSALRDTNPVVRMQAAQAAVAMLANENVAERAAAIGELLLGEHNPHVRAVLLGQLMSDTAAAPQQVDAVLEQLLGMGDDAIADRHGDSGRGVFVLLTYLALVPQTPFASQTVERWLADAPAHAGAAEAFAQHARDYLAPPGRLGQQTAYRLLAVAATASLTRWNRDPGEHLAGAELSDEQLAQLRGAVEVSHGIAQQIYFASGAFDEKRDRIPKRQNLAEFAELAFPVLEICASLHVPQCVHEAVQTMVYLAPLDEARALRAIAAAVPADGPYAGDPLAGNAIIPYLERLLTEQRHLVLFDEDGVAAFRHLLATFAAAGNQAALALAYTFADVFR